ncbi:hypothetical protein QUC31_014214 [Theobroma cacao]|uniref:RING/U-box superfamily protein, putative n=1 Tax=Theobroma cacao TaxID=3641 RepID=A0A061E7G0_THECC|nr:RING/U-box superfamily protein, putative [Theobroma cacao]
MVIALAFAILLLFSFPVYFVYHLRRCLPSFIRESTICSHVILIATRLEWALDFMLRYCLFPRYNFAPNMPEIGAGRPSARDYEWKRAAPTDAGECPVCLFKVQEGEEIGQLRCSHVFHRLCLETWVGYWNATCPLCRGSVAPARLDSELGEEVVAFDFCSLSSRDRGRWWLR